jgi:hypothetical protein
LSSAPSDKQYVDIVDIYINKARDKRLNNFNDILSDRKPNFYFDNINKNN